MIIHVKISRKRYYDLLEKKKKEYGSDDRNIDKRKIEKQLKELDEKKKKIALEREKEDIILRAQKKLLEKQRTDL